MEEDKQREKNNDRRKLGIIKQYRNGKIIELNTIKTKESNKDRIIYEEETRKDVTAERKEPKEFAVCRERKLAYETEIDDLKEKYNNAITRIKKLETEDKNKSCKVNYWKTS